jgi:hypothetical protein
MKQKAASPDSASTRRSHHPTAEDGTTNDRTRAVRRSRRAWPAPARTTAAIIATAGLALLAACGGSGSSTGSGSPSAGGSTTSPSAVGYSACMRSDGVPNFPDPESSGHVPKADAQQLGVSPSQLQAAERACRHLYPTTGGPVQQQTQQCEETGDCPQALVQRILTVQRKYARCIRSHGVPNWPDPAIDSHGRPYFNVSRAGLSSQYTHSSLFESKDRECERAVSGSSGGVPVAMG